MKSGFMQRVCRLDRRLRPLWCQVFFCVDLSTLYLRRIFFSWRHGEASTVLTSTKDSIIKTGYKFVSALASDDQCMSISSERII